MTTTDPAHRFRGGTREGEARALVALVTGATSGIGAEIAKRLRQDGFMVIISGRSVERGERVARELGDTVHFVQADLTAPRAAEELVETTIRVAGNLDVLINNAAVDRYGYTDKTNPKALGGLSD